MSNRITKQQATMIGASLRYIQQDDIRAIVANQIADVLFSDEPAKANSFRNQANVPLRLGGRAIPVSPATSAAWSAPR